MNPVQHTTPLLEVSLLMDFATSFAASCSFDAHNLTIPLFCPRAAAALPDVMKPMFWGFRFAQQEMRLALVVFAVALPESSGSEE